MTEQTITTNAFATEYDALYTATTSGTDAETLAAIARLCDADEDIAAWFAKEAGVSVSNLRRTLSYADAMPVGAFDEETHGEIIEHWSSIHVKLDEPDITDMLDAAAAFGTLSECLDWLGEESPKQRETICRRYGIEGYTEESAAEIAKDMGCSKTWVDRLKDRGTKRLGEMMRLDGYSPDGGV